MVPVLGVLQIRRSLIICSREGEEVPSPKETLPWESRLTREFHPYFPLSCKEEGEWEGLI
jgi:hypothetical protein